MRSIPADASEATAARHNDDEVECQRSRREAADREAAVYPPRRTDRRNEAVQVVQRDGEPQTARVLDARHLHAGQESRWREVLRRMLGLCERTTAITTERTSCSHDADNLRYPARRLSRRSDGRLAGSRLRAAGR